MSEAKIKQLILEVISDVLDNTHYYVDEGESFDKNALQEAVDETRRKYVREDEESSL